MDIQVVGKTGSTLSVSDDIFTADYNQALVHQVLTIYMTNSRQGSKAQKNRAAVNGGGAKPWRQKGTGRARAGTSRGPIWRGGGVTFAASAKEYNQKVNKKMYRKALASMLSELQRQERLQVIDTLAIAEPKTKLVKDILAGLKLKSVLMVVDEFNENLFLGVRNIPRVGVCTASELNPLDLMSFDNFLVTAPALKLLEERLSL